MMIINKNNNENRGWGVGPSEVRKEKEGKKDGRKGKEKNGRVGG